MQRNSFLEIIAVRSLITVLPSTKLPILRERLNEFSLDRGPIGYVLTDYWSSNGNLEDTCRRYWNTRIEQKSPRLEDLVTGILISFATSLVASAVIELWKVLPQLKKANKLDLNAAPELDKIQALKEKTQKNLELIFTLYAAKNSITHDDPSVETKIIDAVERIRSGGDVNSSIRDLIDPRITVATPDELKFIKEAARGVLQTEETRLSGDLSAGVIVPTAAVKLKGLPLSPILGFGEIARPPKDIVEDILAEFGLGATEDEVIAALRSLLAKPVVDRASWPIGTLNDVLSNGGSKKILLISDHLFSRLFRSSQHVWEQFKIGGVITTSGGMTSHAAVLCRGMGIPCLGIPREHANTILEKRFACLNGESLLLFTAAPGEFLQMLS